MQGTMDRPSEAKGRGWREARAVGFKDTQNEGLEGSTRVISYLPLDAARRHEARGKGRVNTKPIS
jgi:hypothetical protein